MLFRVVALLLSVAPVYAGSLTMYFQTRPYSAGTSLATASAYISNWNSLISTYPTPPSGYGQAYLTNYSSFSNSTTFSGSNSNIATHILMQFYVAPAYSGTWSFRFGVDFGYGGVLLIDGNVVEFRNTDMWWNNAFTDTTQYLDGTATLLAGTHTIEIYGLEGCCDGTEAGQFRVGTGSWQTFDTGSTYFSIVPEPGSVSMVIVGLSMLGIGLARKRRRDVPGEDP